MIIRFIPPLRAHLSIEGDQFVVVGHKCLIGRGNEPDIIVFVEGVQPDGSFAEWRWYHPDEGDERYWPKT